MVREILTERLKLDARITVLGHVQRGGSPSAFDRVLGSRSGVKAVLTLMELPLYAEPLVVGIRSNKLIHLPLRECIENIRLLKDAFNAGDFEEVIRLRGRSFVNNINIYKDLNKPIKPNVHNNEVRNVYAIINIGTPAGGMNASIHSFVRSTIRNGGKVLGVFGGVEGLVFGNFQEINWSDVYGLMYEGGSFLGTKRMVPPDELLPLIAENFKKFSIEALLIVGGFEAFVTAKNLLEHRGKHREFCIPIAVIPATTSNNVPGTYISVGSDTALNSIVKVCDLFRQSAMGTKNRVFVVETMGGRCGYLCSVGALASGADASYIFEDPFNIEVLVKDVVQMVDKMKHGGAKRGLILRNECCNDNYTTDFITKLYSEEGKSVFTTRKNILGHIQQGEIPSCFDRCLAVKLSVRTVIWFQEVLDRSRNAEGKIHTNSDDTVVTVGVSDEGYTFKPIRDLVEVTDFFNRFSTDKWWLKLRCMTKMLASRVLKT